MIFKVEENLVQLLLDIDSFLRARNLYRYKIFLLPPTCSFSSQIPGSFPEFVRPLFNEDVGRTVVVENVSRRIEAE